MQGWGNILNLSVLLFFLAVQGQTGPDYSFRALSVTWRMQYALGLLPIMYMLAYRIFYLKESAIWQVLLQAESARLKCLTPLACILLSSPIATRRSRLQCMQIHHTDSDLSAVNTLEKQIAEDFPNLYFHKMRLVGVAFRA